MDSYIITGGFIKYEKSLGKYTLETTKLSKVIENDGKFYVNDEKLGLVRIESEIPNAVCKY